MVEAWCVVVAACLGVGIGCVAGGNVGEWGASKGLEDRFGVVVDCFGCAGSGCAGFGKGEGEEAGEGEGEGCGSDGEC